MTTKGLVFDIQRFSIHDGPGIRTTVFLKGCPLSCLWCHNPESNDPHPEISFDSSKCAGCGFCFRTCLQGCHVMRDGRHVFLREKCRRCGACAGECFAKALEVIGREMTADAVLAEVLRDKPFYETSGGGMTLSGGEPMAQFEFSLALLQLARREGLHTCVETSGIGPTDRFLAWKPFADIFLWDCKETDPARHEHSIGVRPDTILANLRAVDDAGAAIILRCPIVPGCNDRPDHFAAIAQLANALRNVREINVEPYHPLGKAKSERLARAPALPETSFPDDPTVTAWTAAVQAGTRIPVRRL